MRPAPSPPSRPRHARLAGVALVCVALLAPVAVADAKCTKAGGKGADVLIGTKKRDVLCGKGGDDVLIAKGGNDVLRGGGGADTLTASSGNDKVSGGGGDDTLTAGKGNDKLKGGGGLDVAAYADAPGRVSVDLAQGRAGGHGSDTLATVENAIGSPFDDELRGDGAANELSAGAGNDHLVGAGGDDRLEGQAGADSITYAAATGPVTADLGAGRVSGEGSDVVSGIESLTGSAHPDLIVGDDADNLLDGAAGADTVSFAGATAAVDADIGFGGSTGDGTDTLISFEHLTGSAHADRLTGTGAGNVIDGGGGDDALHGGGGSDELRGGGGSDTAAYGSAPGPVTVDLRAGSASGEGADVLSSVENATGSPYGDLLAGSAGANVLDGAGGTDTVSFAASPAPVFANLASGTTSGDGADTVREVENAIGSAQGDSIAGTSVPNAIAGGGGDDTLDGVQGDDQLHGENGNDQLFGAADDDQIFGAAGDDHLEGGGGVNQCDGGPGANTFGTGCDGVPPLLEDLSIAPPSVDTSGGSQQLDFALTASDASSGVDPAASRVIVHGPSGAPTFEAPLTPLSGDDYTAQITLPRWSAQGTWTIEVRLADQAGNQDLVTTAELTGASLPSSFEQEGAGDDAGPVLTALSGVPAAIDTEVAPVDLDVALTVTDDLAGVDPAASRLIVRGPGGAPVFETDLQPAAGDDYTASVTIPRYSPQGTWTLELLLVDQAANLSEYLPDDLANGGFASEFEQTGSGDTAAPLLTAFGRTPAQINTAELDQVVSFTLSATDALAGVDPAASRVIALDPVSQPRAESPLTLASGSAQNGSYSAAVTIPQGSATGTWTLRVELVDAVGNVRVITPAELAAAGWPSTFQNVAPSGS